MSRLPIFTEEAAGGDRAYLDAIGVVWAVKFSTNYNGDYTADWQMQLDPKTDHRALTPGRTVRIPYGANKGWSGFLNNPRRGDVWTLNATGAPSYANDYLAHNPAAGNNTVDLDAIVDDAISRGLPWTRPATLPSLAHGTQPSTLGRLTDSLNTVCDANGDLWNVSRAGDVTAAARPTNVAYLLEANDTAGGRTVIGFVTDVYVTYYDSASWTVKTVLRSATARPYGRFEDVLDLTSLGPISAADADSHGDNWLAKRGPRLRFTQAFTVPAGQLLSVGGTPVDLATVQASDGCVRVLLTDPDSAAGEFALGAVTVPMGITEYDADAEILTLTPMDTTPTGLTAVLS